MTNFFAGEGGVDLSILRSLDEAPSTVEDVESPNLSRERKTQATDQALNVMREVFDGLDRYAVFASTAVYLHGKKQNLPDLQTPPGDFDAVVFDRSTLDLLRERLRRVPGAQLENDGQYTRYVGEQTLGLKGSIPVEVMGDSKPKTIAVPFEIFFSTHLVPASVNRRRQKIQGLQALSLDALKDQYVKNLEFESRIQRSVDEVITYLARPEIIQELQSNNELATALSERFRLTKEELQQTYQDLFALSKEKPPAEHERLVSQLAKRLAGIKTKIPGRERSINKITKAVS